MARRTASSKSSRTRKKTGPATQRLDPSRLFSSQYPPAQLYETWVQQLRDRLATAAAGEAAALSQELALECRARDVAVRRAAMIENIWKAREAEAADKAGQKPDLLHMFKTNLEHQRLMDQLNDLAREGSVIASHTLGALILENPVTRLDPGAPRLNDPNKDREKEREKAREKALQDAGAFLSFAAERGFTPAYSDLARWYRNREEHEAAEQWLAKALKAKEPPALLEAGEILLMPVPLPADKLHPLLDRLCALALDHCWGALELLCRVCKLRRNNAIVSALAPKVLLEAMEPAPQKRQKELAADMDKAILRAREQADASALYLFGCVASLHLEDPDLNAVCRYYDARHCRKSGETPYKSDFAAHTACATFTSGNYSALFYHAILGRVDKLGVALIWPDFRRGHGATVSSNESWYAPFISAYAGCHCRILILSTRPSLLARAFRKEYFELIFITTCNYKSFILYAL